MILVVDDEHNLADTLSAILSMTGYRVLTSYCAEEALEVLSTEKPALIISDVVMPGLHGVELAIEAQRLWPGVPVLLMSGNVATQQIMEDARQEGHLFELLAKPVPPKELLMKIASILSNEPSTALRNAAAN